MGMFYRYSIVRFRPYAETGEFANIGVVVFDLDSERASFRLANKRFARIGHFFDPIAHAAYGQAIENLRIELPRILEFVPEVLSRNAEDQFSDLFGSRESSVLFSSPRVIKSDLNLEGIAEKLFSRFVQRDFDKSPDPEVALTKDIRHALHKRGIKHFRSLTISDEIVPVRFPLAHRNNFVSAIKPLAFYQKNPMHVLDYGAHWKKRLSYHLDRRNICEQSVFIAVEGPREYADDLHFEAFELALQELRKLPFEVSKLEIKRDQLNPELLHFVDLHPPSQGALMN